MICGNCPGACLLWRNHKVVFENEEKSSCKEEYESKKTLFGKLKERKVKDETEFIGIEDKSRQ